jgi:hypothetical protein
MRKTILVFTQTNSLVGSFATWLRRHRFGGVSVLLPPMHTANPAIFWNSCDEDDDSRNNYHNKCYPKRFCHTCYCTKVFGLFQMLRITLFESLLWLYQPLSLLINAHDLRQGHFFIRVN